MADDVDVKIAIADIRKATEKNRLACGVASRLEGFSTTQRASVLLTPGAVEKMADAGHARDMVRFISGQPWEVRAGIMQVAGVEDGLRRAHQQAAIENLHEGIRIAAFRQGPKCRNLTLVA